MKDHSLYTIIPYKNKLIKCFNPKHAYAYYLNKRINLLTGVEEKISIKNWIENYQQEKLFSTFRSPRIVHLFYELGFLTEHLNDFIQNNQLLVIDISYHSFEDFVLTSPSEIKLSLLRKPDFEKYKKAFEEGYQQLLLGNCYQFNLTQSYQYSFSSHLGPHQFIMSLWKNKNSRGAFGSATYISYFKKLYLSNSPECLFQINETELSTMPIKGTIK